MMTLLLITIWLGMTILTAAGLHADFMVEYKLLACDPRWVRKDLTMSLLIGMLPPVWIFAPFFTGFYQDGFTLTLQARP